MRLEVDDDGLVIVTLSERNLRALLAKVQGQPAESVCAIRLGRLLVHAEPDAVHYANRLAPGAMSPATEAAILKGEQ
jgi:hypothetical protein